MGYQARTNKTSGVGGWVRWSLTEVCSSNECCSLSDGHYMNSVHPVSIFSNEFIIPGYDSKADSVSEMKGPHRLKILVCPYSPMNLIVITWKNSFLYLFHSVTMQCYLILCVCDYLFYDFIHEYISFRIDFLFHFLRSILKNSCLHTLNILQVHWINIIYFFIMNKKMEGWGMF